MNNDNNPALDPILTEMKRSWEAALEAGCNAIKAEYHHEAISFFSQSITQSTHLHPLFHFLESALNTELATLYLHQNNVITAKKLYERALWLDHENETAKQALDTEAASNLPPYRLSRKISHMPKGDIWKMREQAKTQQSISLYKEAIELCEATHSAYHTAAALPWLHRAQCYLAMDERILAKNDGRQGLNLAPANPTLMGLANLNITDA